MGLLGMPLGMSAESCGNDKLFLLQATSKDHAEDDIGGFFSPHCFLSFILTAGICVLPFFYQKILLVTAVCRPQRAGFKQSLMSCRAGCPLLGPYAGTPGACQPKVAQHWAPLAPPSQSNLLANGSPCAEFGFRAEAQLLPCFCLMETNPHRLYGSWTLLL